MRSVIAGLIGGLISVLVTLYVAKRVGRSAKGGELRFGAFMWVLALGCLAMALMPVLATVLAGHSKDLMAKVLLTLGFGIGAAYCLGEVTLVKGRFDALGISFFSPWTGAKEGKWQDLESVELNDWCSWYTLTFRDGTVIRLSRYLGGHLSALDAAGAVVRSNKSLERSRDA